MASPFGTAPRRQLPGVWITATGHRLTPAQTAIWERYFKLNITDGRGHFNHQKADTLHTALHGTASQRKAAGKVFGNDARAQQRSVSGPFGAIAHVAYAGTPIGAITHAVHHPGVRSVGAAIPVAGPNFEQGLDTARAGKNAARAVRGGHLPGAADTLALAGLFPGFRGGSKAARAAKLERGLHATEEAVGPEHAVMDVMGDAKKARGAQNRLYSMERKRRFEKLSSAHKEAGGGLEGLAAKSAAMRGALPKLRFDDLTGLKDEDMHHLINLVEESDLSEANKFALQKGLTRVHGGEVPRDFEIKLVEHVFGTKAAQEFANPSFASKAAATVADVLNIPRSILSTGDVSASLRQGLVGLFLNPKAWAKAQGPQFRALLSEKNSVALRQTLEADPEFDVALKHGLAATDMENVLHREERFSSNIAEKISPGLLIGKPGKFSPIRASGRAYTTFLNALRFSIWKDLVESVGGVEAASKKQLEDAAKVANWATGRGGVGKFEKSAAILNATFFSPRLMASRFQAFNPVFYYKLDPTIRKQARGATLKMVATGSALLGAAALGGAKIGMDPRSADWGKIKVGNTRFDIWGGHQQLARLMAQVATGQVVSSTDGKLIVKGGWGGRGGAQVIGRFVRGKLQPTTSFAVDWFMNSDYSGQPLAWKKEVLSRSIPLLVQDVSDVAHQTHSPWGAIGAYGVGAAGIGVQSYGPPKPKNATVGGFGDSNGNDVWANYGTPSFGSSNDDSGVWDNFPSR